MGGTTSASRQTSRHPHAKSCRNAGDDATLPEHNTDAHDAESYIPHSEHPEAGVPQPLGAQQFTAPVMGGGGI